MHFEDGEVLLLFPEISLLTTAKQGRKNVFPYKANVLSSEKYIFVLLREFLSAKKWKKVNCLIHFTHLPL